MIFFTKIEQNKIFCSPDSVFGLSQEGSTSLLDKLGCIVWHYQLNITESVCNLVVWDLTITKDIHLIVVSKVITVINNGLLSIGLCAPTF